LSGELYERLEKVASKTALSLEEVAKFILAQELARERLLDLAALINRGREFFARLIRESRKES
ncbi:unnamed protein product, partial [marine sediment metagenome]